MRTKIFAIATLILLSPLTSFAEKPYLGDFKLDVHIRETQLQYGCNTSLFGSPEKCGMRLVIVAIVAGEKLLLRANNGFVLRTGDYKAREKTEAEATDSKPKAYVDSRVFELLLPDGKFLTFEVIGESQD